MDLRFTPEEIAFRQEVRDFIRENLPADIHAKMKLGHGPSKEDTVRWQRILNAKGWAGLSWGKENGGPGWTAIQKMIFLEENQMAPAPELSSFNITMIGPVLIQFGTEEQKKYYLPRILSGDDVWCQGYSEPNAGSDLSNLGLKAQLDGDQWILNGQKIWTSAGHLADHIFTLARTDPDAPRHKGISFILVDMRQPGVEVRPIKMISGESEFNEVFYTDAVAPKDNVVGGVNNGWAVAMTLLGFERGAAAAVNSIRYQAELDRLMAMTKDYGKNNDPKTRQRLAWCYTQVQLMKFLGYRTLTQFLKGHQPGPDAAISKLAWSEYHKLVTELAMDVMGADGLVPTGRAPSSAFGADDPGAPNSTNSWAMTFLNARAGTIYAGSSQIQKNIVGEMVLGLPKEPVVKDAKSA